MKSRIDTLEVELKRLADQGCFPCISLRGFDRGKQVWRAHVNGAGAFWAEASTPAKALHDAVREWDKAGRPKDGYAASPRGRE